ncbi:hypothetical protein ACFS5M_02580 [Lacinutrix iliipiscaria]|uniref:Uncharacterized protein n=1 Tax=Lacinutrix iliipiscaria TaxID=1230532 RepID=A0ABW5WIH9_9FLAO
MKTTQQLLAEISELTREIETNFPEVYQHLDENPLTLANSPHPEVNDKALDNYLESLKNLIKHYK